MKTAKKILSVVLAVVLILSTVVVAANAVITPSSKMVVTFKVEVMDATEGAAAEVKEKNGENVQVSNTKNTTLQAADVKAYKALEEHEYADTSKPVEVKPGQVVWVTEHVYFEDFYNVGFELYPYYSANMFLSGTIGGDKQFIIPESYWADLDMTTTVNPWSKLPLQTREKYVTKLEDPTAYHAFFSNCFSMAYDALEGMFVDTLDFDFVTFPLYVDPDAEVGTVGDIAYNLSKTGGADQFEDGDVYGAQEKLPLKQLINGPRVSFVVVGDEEELDYTELQAQIDAFDALTESDYTADTWAEAKEYYDAAVAAKTDAKTQDEVDEAAGNLADAIEALEPAGPVLDFTALNNALAEVPADLSGYTTSSVAALNAAKDAAEAAKSATTQAEIDKAAQDLFEAIDDLEDKADLTALNNALADAAAVNKDNYTPETVKTLEDAVAAGQALVAQADDLADAAAVTKAANDIKNAIKALTPKGADYSRVNAAETTIAGLKEADYTAASWKAVTDAEAAVVTGYDITKQAAVNAMADTLEAAIAGLKKVADTSALEAAIAAAAAADDENYAADVWEAIQNDVALANTYVGAGLAEDDVQAEIDALTAKINGELANTMGAADYSAVDAALANIPADLSGYTDASVAALNDAVNAVDRNLKADKQDDVDAMAKAIEDAITGLETKKADYTALEAAIANADAKVGAEALYTAESYAAYKTAYDAAKAVEPDQDYTAQDAIDAAAKALDDAVTGLVYAGANWDAIDEIVGKINALDKDMYTADSLAALDSAAKTAMDMYNAKADYDVNNQGEIDKAAADANKAFDNLVMKDADYTAVNEAKDAVAALKKSNYTDDSWKAVENAVAAVVEGKKIDEQAAVDAMAKAINDAVTALILKDADYSSVDGKIAQADKLSAKNYTTDSWTALQDAIDAVERGLKADKQADVDAMAVAIEKAINGLVPASSADYTEVNALVDEYNNDVDPALYTDDSYAAYTAAVKAVDYNLNANEQAKVDDMAKAIKEAKAALILKDADYTAVNEAKDDFAAIDTAKYTEDSVKAVEDAIAAVVEGKKIDEQAAVDAMAKAINDAIGALELKGADYTAVDEAIAKFEAMDKSAYTGASVKAVENAIAAVVPGKTIDEQADVDAMAKAIEDAMNGLKTPAGVVTNVEIAATPYNFKSDIAVTVESRAWKVQFIDEAGSTVTFDRTAHPEYITSYDKDGNEVNSLSRDVAYEIWNVSTTLNPGKYTVIAKSDSEGWESKDLGYEVIVEKSNVYTDIVSLEPSSTSTATGAKLPVTIVTGKDVIKVQILVDSDTDGIKTFDAGTYATLDGDQYTYSVYAKLYAKGDHTLKVKYKTADGWKVCDDIVANVTAG